MILRAKWCEPDLSKPERFRGVGPPLHDPDSPPTSLVHHDNFAAFSFSATVSASFWKNEIE